MDPTPLAADVLSFWFGDALQSDWPAQSRGALWFGGGAEQDALITRRFGPAVHAALAGELGAWEADPAPRLALVILLDQLARNVFRGQARAFAGDAMAQRLVLHTLARGEDGQLPRVGRVFGYMPLMHAEDPALQAECVKRFEALIAGAPPEIAAQLAGNLKAAREHQAIVARFGRFPHRNAILGRESTPEETEFLRTGPRFGQ